MSEIPRPFRYHRPNHDMCAAPADPCLFNEPFVSTRLCAESRAGIAELREQSERADDRSFAILHAIVVEQRIDALLEPVFPRYAILREAQWFGLANKIALLRALELVPAQFLRAAKLALEVRNKFAHYAEISTFEHAEVQKLRPQFEGLLREPCMLPNCDDAAEQRRLRIARHAEIEAATMRDLYIEVNGHCTMGLLLYRDNLRLLRETIRSKAFLGQLCLEFERRRDAESEAEFALLVKLPTLDKDGNVIPGPFKLD